LAHFAPTGVTLIDTLREQLYSPLGTQLVFLLRLLEELNEFLITAQLGISNILLIRLTTLQSVIQNTHQIVMGVLYTCLTPFGLHIHTPYFSAFTDFSTELTE